MIGNGTEVAASPASAVCPALREDTRTTYLLLATVGVQDHVAFVVHVVAFFQVLPSYTDHLYWYGATPPDADADHRIVLPTICGEALFARSVTELTAGAVTVKGTDLVSSPVVLLLPELRTATLTW